MHKKGFTLIELIIVIVIIGILASISAPMMSGMKAKAVSTEAIGAMGAIRTALRAYYAEYNDYPLMNGFASAYPDELSAIGLSVDALTGTYFSSGCYYFYCGQFPSGASSIRAYAIGPGVNNSAPRHEETERIVDDPSERDEFLYPDAAFFFMYLNDAIIQQHNISRSGYPVWVPQER